METITLEFPFHTCTLHACVRKSAAPAPRACIFYLHGGGLVFGESNDLPGPYQKLILSAGYDLVRLDYPLAPEAKLPDILDAVHASVSRLLSEPSLLGYEAMPPYLLFGRSAGAYLALTEANRLLKDSALPHPLSVLAFYGYRSFLLPEFRKPAPAYTKLPAVPASVVSRLTGGGVLTEGPMSSRYSIYIHARQTGTWPDLLGTEAELSAAALSDADLKAFPPCFFTASSSDADVPFRESKQMARLIPGSKFHPVYYLEHDFDRDLSKNEGMEAYKAALSWLSVTFFS